MGIVAVVDIAIARKVWCRWWLLWAMLWGASGALASTPTLRTQAGILLTGLSGRSKLFELEASLHPATEEDLR